MSEAAQKLPDNFLSLSDEEFEKLDLSQLPENDTSSTQGGEEGSDAGGEGQAQPETDSEDTTDQIEDGESETPEESSGEAEPQAGDSSTEGDTEEDTEAEADSDEDSETEDDNDEEETSDESDESDVSEDNESSEKNDDSEETDIKSFYEQVTAPFTANGRQMKVDSPEDVVRLMQMGANYNKKMAALKPNLKLLRMLEKHELLDEQKLSFLIDVEKRDPQAIAKLLKDSQIDPMDIDTETSSDYTPKTYTVSDAEVELSQVVAEIRDTPTYERTVDILTTKWDGDSREIIGQNPELLRVINDQIAAGVYDLIEAEMEREKSLGRLQGVRDIEAYQTIGKQLQAKGAFNHLVQGGNPENKGQKPPQRKTVKPEGKKQDDARRNKRKAAGTSKTAAAKPEPQFNPLSMSDEEFEKQFDGQLL